MDEHESSSQQEQDEVYAKLRAKLNLVNSKHDRRANEQRAMRAREVKSAQVNFKVRPSWKARLNQVAAARGESASEIVERAVNEYLAKLSKGL